MRIFINKVPEDIFLESTYRLNPYLKYVPVCLKQVEFPFLLPLSIHRPWGKFRHIMEDLENPPPENVPLQRGIKQRGAEDLSHPEPLV